MDEDRKTTRPYRSRTRERQAADTRQAILEAAAALIAGRGYAATTIAAVAERAGVAAPTVYFSFGSKRALLTALHEQITQGVELGPTFARLLAEPNPRRQLQLAVHITRRLEETAGAIMEAARVAGGADAELRATWQEAEAGRRAGLTRLVHALATRDQLRTGLTEARAVDILWSMVSHDMHRLLVESCDWTGEEYEQWLTETLVLLLLD